MAEITDTELTMFSSDDEIFLAEQAGAIRVLGKRVVHDVVEIGQRLRCA
jgi:hypothetical protein